MAEQPEITEGLAGPMVEFHFTPEPGDFSQAMRAFLWRDVRVWISMGLVGIMLVGGLANLVAGGEPTIMGLVLVLFPLLLAAYLWWGWPMSVGRRVQRDRRLRSPTTYQVGDERFVTRNVLGESSLEWAAFHRLVETRAHYLLVFDVSRRTFVVVPRRAFASAEQEAAFRDIVKRHLPGLRE
jgi:hypothetical protein